MEKHLSIQSNALNCHIFDTWWFEYALFTWLDKIRININILAILTNCALWMKFYLAMQNEAIAHEKLIKSGMCKNIYTQFDICFNKYNLHRRDQKKKKIAPRYLMIRLKQSNLYANDLSFLLSTYRLGFIYLFNYYVGCIASTKYPFDVILHR